MKSYNSKLPLSSYRIGEACRFYFANSSSAEKASADEIARYGDLFDDEDIIFRNSEIPNTKQMRVSERTLPKEELGRYVGIIIEKLKTSTGGRLTVLFKTEQAGYVKIMYVCAHPVGVSTDGRDIMPAKTTMDCEKGNKSKSAVSGITLSRGSTYKNKSSARRENLSDVSGITLENRHDKKLSGITLANRDRESKNTVSGVTLANREQYTDVSNNENSNHIKLSRKNR